MAVKKVQCDCVLCGHPIVKLLAEFYFVVWGIIGLLFLICMIWGFVKFKTFEKNGLFKGMMAGEKQEMSVKDKWMK